MEEALTPAQRRTLPARQALAAKFSSPEEKSEHFRSLARRSHERRLTLSGDEAAALLHFHELLGSIVEPNAARRGSGACTEGGSRCCRLACRHFVFFMVRMRSPRSPSPILGGVVAPRELIPSRRRRQRNGPWRGRQGPRRGSR